MEATIKKTVSGTLGTGMNFLFGGNRSYYILEHKISSQYHKLGESQHIIVDRIQIGRAKDCEVRFDDSFQHVSRHHAAIIRDGDRWKLIHLSETNSTFLNGQKIQHEWYLQNGDEIQLSQNGPKLGFIIPPSGGAKTMGMTARMNLFREQALKPYKTAIIVVSAILLLAIGGAIALGVIMHNKNEELVETTNEQASQLIESRERLNEQDSINKIQKDYLNKQQRLIQEQINDLSKQKEDLEKLKAELNKAIASADKSGEDAKAAQKQADEAARQLDKLNAELEELKRKQAADDAGRENPTPATTEPDFDEGEGSLEELFDLFK